MAIANVYMIGLQMFSDVGLRQSVIQSRRGDEPEFLNTIWTMQILRGFSLWIVSCMIAYPVAKFYDADILLPILCVLGFSAAVKGFQTTAYATANRNLLLGRITALELVSQGIGIVATVVWAAIHPSVWALAGGGVITAIITVVIGYFLLPTHRHRLHWDRLAASEIVRFGRWIFLATILGYLANNGDRLILGKYMTPTDFGMYAIALTWAGLLKTINATIGERVLVPIYAARRDATAADMRPKILKMRLAKAAFVIPVSVVLIVFGQQLIDLMYDDRYHDSGWMLRVLSVGVGFHALMNIGDFMLSRGRSGLFFATVCLATATSVGCMTVGGALAGSNGIILGVAATPVVGHVYMILIYRQYGYWLWKLDVLFITALAITVLIAKFVG